MEHLVLIHSNIYQFDSEIWDVMNKKKENFLSKDLEQAIRLAKSGSYEEALKLCKKIESNNINNAIYFKEFSTAKFFNSFIW